MTSAVLVSAHKGGTERAQAATYEAYRDAVTTGAEYVELDIRKTGDGVLVVRHDPLVPNGAAGAGAPAGPAAVPGYEQLCESAGHQVPRVADVLGLIAGQARAHLDLKETGYEAEVIDLATQTVGAGAFIATTLEDESVSAIKRAFPGVPTALSVGRDLSRVPRSRWAGIRASELFPLSRLRACGADWISVNYKLARLGVVRDCHRAGLGIMVWTVDSTRLTDAFLADPRVGVLITNRPRQALARRAAAAAREP
jgi:glycerophosphoryl diester phosphodiesterase